MGFVVPFSSVYLPTFTFCFGVATIYGACSFPHLSDTTLTSLFASSIAVEGIFHLKGLEDQVNSFDA